MQKHAAHFLVVVIPVAIAAAGAIAASPAWKSFVEHHAATGGIILAFAGAIRVAWKAYQSSRTGPAAS